MLSSAQGGNYTLRKLLPGDGAKLGDLFLSLSSATLARFGPHPMTRQHSAFLCSRSVSDGSTERFVLEAHDAQLVGYFIFENSPCDNEKARYRGYGIDIGHGLHLRFAPLIADQFQGLGLAPLVMPHLIQRARSRAALSIVLMGGTQKTNVHAVHFYRNMGFVPAGQFSTEIENYDMYLPLNNDQRLDPS